MVRLGGIGRRRGLGVGLGEALLPDWARGARIRRADAATCFEYCERQRHLFGLSSSYTKVRCLLVETRCLSLSRDEHPATDQQFGRIVFLE